MSNQCRSSSCQRWRMGTHAQSKVSGPFVPVFTLNCCQSCGFTSSCSAWVTVTSFPPWEVMIPICSVLATASTKGYWWSSSQVGSHPGCTTNGLVYQCQEPFVATVCLHLQAERSNIGR